MKPRAQQTKAAARATGSSFGGFGGSGGAEGTGSLSYLAEPPSFSAVADPNVVVYLKNVLKKDSTTKTKALEDLLLYAQAHPFETDGGVEEAILEVWAQIYPRTSIDNSGRVRGLSHGLQYELLKSARKRMERHIPKIVGAWLAGLFDRDRAAARAASDGLSSILTTPEKVAGFWKKCQAQILDYAIDAMRETQDTLSDERSTTKEDAEAKYIRVITAGLSLVLGLLQKLDDGEINKMQSKYDEFFSEETVWRSITFGESTVRKTVCQLLIKCIDRKLPYADSVNAKQAIVTGGLKVNQSGSALDYVRALNRLTQAHPDIWTPSAKEKKTPLARLQIFIAKGSQGCPARFWEELDHLLSILPGDQIHELDVASNLLAAVKSGITNREEPRTNTSMSWKCYIDVAKRSLAVLSDDDKLSFTQRHLFPLLEQFLFLVSEKPTTIPLGPNAMSTFVEAHLTILQSSSALSLALKEEWTRLATVFCAKISGSLPEVSKEYQSSQENIGEEGRRWFSLVGLIHKELLGISEASLDHTTVPSNKIITHCLALLESRNMKPFGAARTLEYALSTSAHLFSDEVGQKVSGFLLTAAEESFEKVSETASLRHLLSCVNLLSFTPSQAQRYEVIWKVWVEAALKLAVGPRRASILASLISHDEGSKLCREHQKLQEDVISQAIATAKGDTDAWNLLDAAVTFHGLSDDNCQLLVQSLVSALENDVQHRESCLRALGIVAKGSPHLFAQNEDVHAALVAQLLSLSEIGDGTVSSKAIALRSLLDNHEPGKSPSIGIIQSNLERAGPQSLEIQTLVKQTQHAIESNLQLEELFPNTNVWMQGLAPFLGQPINPSISITNSLGGAAYLGKSNSGVPQGTDLRLPRDRKGRSAPLRMALYAGLLFEQNQKDVLKLPRQFQIELLYLQCLSAQLVTDQMTSRLTHGLWATLENEESMSEAESLVCSVRNFIKQHSLASMWWVSTSNDEASEVFRGLVDLLREESKALTPQGVYSARAIGEIVQTVAETYGLPSGLDETLMKIALQKAAPETALFAAALVSGFGQTLRQSKLANNFANRLVSDVAGASPDSEKTMMVLVLLTLSAQVYERGDLPVANNRIVFAVRQITSWFDEPEKLSAPLCAEICRVLSQLLPCMNEVFGSYWDKTIQFCIDLWNRANEYPLSEALPFVHSSLKLMKVLETMAEPNDDLQDAIREAAAEKSKSIIELLKLSRETESQPLEIVDSILCREVESISIRQIPDVADIFGLIGADSRDIQSAAFNLLHRAIPAAQEQHSIDILLDKTDARLPDELLSLLLDAPTLERYSDDLLAQFPVPIRCYLLSWKLVFDAFSTSSFKIRGDFTENLKADDCLSPLLDFMFDVLGHSAAHALSLDKENLALEHIKDYDIKLAESESEEKSMQWLLVHLFYLTLKYIPGLFKAWYINCRKKQTRIAVEAWTSKYFSPLIISETLDEVQVWSDQQESSPDEQELLIKVSKTAKEVIAGYEVDEAQASIVIKVPASYPIEAVTVTGQNRVAVNERTWQSWIMTTQGVITFSNGSIIDGLQVFKRNMVGALKGQSECAICYSIISADKRMPDKKCSTCKNMFHRTCLYKWFQSSSQNTCPLCRNPIDYLGADTASRRAK